jgi:hypothetical protein
MRRFLLWPIATETRLTISLMVFVMVCVVIIRHLIQ